MHSEEIRRRKPLVFKVSAVKCTWASIFWWTTSWNLIKIRFPLPERTMRLIILTPNALRDVYTVSAGQDFFGMYASCLSMKKKINIPLGFTIWPAWSSRRLIELGWDAASTNTLMPGQLDMLNALDSLPREPWCVQLNTLHLHTPFNLITPRVKLTVSIARMGFVDSLETRFTWREFAWGFDAAF